MNSKRWATLADIYEKPTRADIRWKDIEKLITALGGVVKEGKGSRKRFLLNDQKAVFHMPHPEPTTNKLTVEDVREFLFKAGVGPDWREPE